MDVIYSALGNFTIITNPIHTTCSIMFENMCKAPGYLQENYYSFLRGALSAWNHAGHTLTAFLD